MKTPGGAESADVAEDSTLPAAPSQEPAAPDEDTGLAQPPPSRLPAPLQVRDPGRYDILGEHGRGGLGTVARAHDKELGRQVAIKELLKRGDAGEVRFLREALITARLEHPGIVPIHEAGRWPDGTPFYVMKLVSGRSLKELIEARRTVEERLALLHHVIAVADAMAYAHRRKIIHRDLKPANVIAGDFGETVVIDWGLAKDLSASGDEPGGEPAPYRGPAQAELTETGTILGTPLYMPPEQWRGEPVDQRADVFAIGAMLWELCSLQRVPPADARLRDRLLRRGGIDRDLAAIVAKALAPDPAARYRDAGELADDLKAFKSGARIAARAYSPLAVIVHWTRRHRALAATVAAAAALVVAGGVRYVRDISIERDRADAAAARAEAARARADAERDNARLSEATALLEKDPTRARDLLAALPQATPRRALLLSRARQRAATHVIRVPNMAVKLLRNATTGAVAVATGRGELAMLDLDAGELEVVARDLQGALTWRADHWVYAHKPFGAQTVTVAATSRPPRSLDVGSLLSAPTSTLLAAGGRAYALDSGDLYTLEARGPALLRRGIRSVAGNEHLLLVCTAAGELEIQRDGVTELRTRCAKQMSTWPMATAGGDYAALLDSTTLLLVRGAQALHLPTRVEAEYELALSASGVLAMADFSDRTWFVRPGGSTLELGPSHSARPMSVAAAGRFAAWGYTDGVVIAIDTASGTSWRFAGHGYAAHHVVIDERRGRVISAGGDELRVWSLAPPPSTRAGRVPCLVLDAAPSLDRTRAVVTCDDGGVHLWAIASGTLQELHRHGDSATRVAWLRGAACSAGYDRRVICTDPEGASQEVLAGAGPIRQLRSSPDQERLVIATNDGKVRELDGTLRLLFAHDAAPYQVAFSPDGRWLASGAADGSVIVWDVARREVRSRTRAHAGWVTSLAWRDGALWTASLDGALKRWRNEPATMTLADTRREQGEIWYLRLLADGWVTSVGRRELLVQRPPPLGTVRLDLDRRVERLEVSPDGRYVVAAASGEVVVIDQVEHAVASLSIATSGFGYLGFVDSSSLVISTVDGLFTVSLPALELARFAPQPSND